LSIAWITPLLAAISACVTCALSTITPPFISAEGDAIYFDSTVPHGYRRIGAKRTTAPVVALAPRE
jgi:hypothetical protein